MPAPFDPVPELEQLADAGVDFVVVGDVARAAHGTAYPAYMLEIMCSTGDERRARALLRGNGSVVPTRRYPDVRRAAETIRVNGRDVRVASLDHLIAFNEERGDNIAKLHAMECRVLADEIRRREAEGES